MAREPLLFFRLIYDEDLAQAAYIIGCSKSGEAIVIDPARDIDRYLRVAEAADLRIIAAAETHVHADFLSGVREFSAHGATPMVSGAGGEQWTPAWVREVEHRLLNTGDTIRIGGISLRVQHTPGHTPEHICYEVTDANTEEPMGVCTGDFVFVGDLGRPDLLEQAVGVVGAMEPAARDLHRSTGWFRDLPAHEQVWPGHGAGSACGKNLGAVPQSTVGYELRHNASLLEAGDPEGFVRAILKGQPDPPAYFARMKRMNIAGPPILGQLPSPRRIGASELPDPEDPTSVVLDMRPWEEFRAGFRARSLNGPLDNTFTPTIASYLDPQQRVYLIAPEAQANEAIRRLVRTGIDNFAGRLEPEEARRDFDQTIDEITVEQAAKAGVAVLDVRTRAEHEAGHAPGARQIAHTRLGLSLDTFEPGQTVHVMCQAGRRSSRAAALLARHGLRPVNIIGGFSAWEASNAPVERASAS